MLETLIYLHLQVQTNYVWIKSMMKMEERERDKLKWWNIAKKKTP